MNVANIQTEENGTCIYITNLPTVEYEGMWAAISRLLSVRGGVWLGTIGHDDDCPCFETSSPMSECSCDEVCVSVQKVQDGGYV